MSMKVLTVLQFISIFTIYTGLFIAVPALLLHRRLKDEIFSVRFFFYIVLGHFYLINLVLFLQLLHISGRFTLILGSALPVVISLVHTKRVSPKKIGHIIGNRTTVWQNVWADHQAFCRWSAVCCIYCNGSGNVWNQYDKYIRLLCIRYTGTQLLDQCDGAE